MNELQKKRMEKQYEAYYTKYWATLALQQAKKETATTKLGGQTK